MMQDASCIISWDFMHHHVCQCKGPNVFKTTFSSFFKRSGNLCRTCDMSLRGTPLSGSNRPCACGSYSPPPPPSPGFAALYFSYMKPQEEDLQICFFHEHGHMRIPNSWTVPKSKEPSHQSVPKTCGSCKAIAQQDLWPLQWTLRVPNLVELESLKVEAQSKQRETGTLRDNNPKGLRWACVAKVAMHWEHPTLVSREHFTTWQCYTFCVILERNWCCRCPHKILCSGILVPVSLHILVHETRSHRLLFIAQCSSISSQWMLNIFTKVYNICTSMNQNPIWNTMHAWY